MDPILNPYNPGAGSRPSYLAGRNGILTKANILFKRVKAGRAQRSIMLYGLRGVGKTVLLNRLNTMATEDGYRGWLYCRTNRNVRKRQVRC